MELKFWCACLRLIEYLTWLKTNQFNLTTKRYTQAELQDFINKGSLIYCLNVKDKFGDNGITVAVIIHLDNEEATLIACSVVEF